MQGFSQISKIRVCTADSGSRKNILGVRLPVI